MNSICTIAKKEFKDFFFSPIAYVFLTIFLLLTFWIFLSGFFVGGQATLRGFFSIIPWMFLIFLPAITMGRWAEEKRAGTLEILLTLPVKDWQVVLGKFFGCVLFLIAAALFTLPLCAAVAALGNPDWGPVLGGYLGFILLGSLFIAVGLFFSSITVSPIVAFILSFIVLFLFTISGEGIIVSNLPPSFGTFLNLLSSNYHFQSIARGVIDSRDLAYYFSVTGFFLYLNVLSLESRKWE